MATRGGYHVPSNLVKDEKENVIAEPASGDVQEAIRERRHGAVHGVHVAGARSEARDQRSPARAR